MHQEAFDESCANCHTTDNPGGNDNSSFCSNSACHGTAWEYAGFDAPGLREILISQLPPPPTPVPVPTGGSLTGLLTYEETIGPLLQIRCGSCHGDNGIQGLNLTNYQAALAGGQSGPSILPGDPGNSLVVAKYAGEVPHFGQLSAQELELVIQWISEGAQEK